MAVGYRGAEVQRTGMALARESGKEATEAQEGKTVHLIRVRYLTRRKGKDSERAWKESSLGPSKMAWQKKGNEKKRKRKATGKDAKGELT